MSGAPKYGHGEMNDQITAWFDAAAAYNKRDMKRAADLLCPINDSDAHTFALLVANVALGAALVGIQLADANGQAPRQPPEGGEWVAEAIDPRREGTAVERLCAMAVTAAANGEPERAIQMVQTFAHPSDRGVQRLTDALMHLLAMFAAVVAEETS